MLCNSSYSSIVYWNYLTLCSIIEAPVCTTKHQQNSWKFCGSQIIICIKQYKQSLAPFSPDEFSLSEHIHGMSCPSLIINDCL